jgi:cytochrome b6-f complex iron-sulfur subunit
VAGWVCVRQPASSTICWVKVAPCLSASKAQTRRYCGWPSSCAPPAPARTCPGQSSSPAPIVGSVRYSTRQPPKLPEHHRCHPPAGRPALYTRRRVLGGATLTAAAAAIAGVIGAGLDHILTGRSNRTVGPGPQAVLVPNTGTRQTVAAGTELPEGGVRAFDTGTVTGFILRTGGSLHAVSGICTHQGCRLAWDAPTRRLRCPCHRAAFALSGEAVQHQLATVPRPLPRLEVREEGGAVQVFGPSQAGVTPRVSEG